MNDVAHRFVHAFEEDRPPTLLEVIRSDGAWTPGPHAVLDAGNEIELTVDELAWLVEDAGPAALARLREEKLHPRAEV